MTSRDAQVDTETIKKIADLAHLELTPKEEALYTEQLAAILKYVSQLSEVDTEGVEPLQSPTPMEMTLREDLVVKFDSSLITGNAPEKSGNLFKVPPVL